MSYSYIAYLFIILSSNFFPSKIHPSPGCWLVALAVPITHTIIVTNQNYAKRSHRNRNVTFQSFIVSRDSSESKTKVYAQICWQWYRYHPNKIAMQNVLHIETTKWNIFSFHFNPNWHEQNNGAPHCIAMIWSKKKKKKKRKGRHKRVIWDGEVNLSFYKVCEQLIRIVTACF